MTRILVYKYYRHTMSSRGREDEGLCGTCKNPKLIHISSTADLFTLPRSHFPLLSSLSFGFQLRSFGVLVEHVCLDHAQVHTSQWSSSSEGNLASAFKMGSLAAAPAVSPEVEEPQPLSVTSTALLPQEYEVDFLPGLLGTWCSQCSDTKPRTHIHFSISKGIHDHQL